MKSLFTMTAVLLMAVFQGSIAQAPSKAAVPGILKAYYNIKDALVAGDPNTAAKGALLFVKSVNSVDYKEISEGNIHLLAADAVKIADTREIDRQRIHFARLSANMAEVAKVAKLGDQVVYRQYCPMKKAVWLSNEKTIKNPYYGSTMLTCGEVTATIE